MTKKIISKKRHPLSYFYSAIFTILVSLFLSSCNTLEVIESPKTGFPAETTEIQEPEVIWTSRDFHKSFDYLGVIKTKAFTYEGALEQLIAGGKELRADAVIDLHHEQTGFMTLMTAFAIKYK